MQEGGKNSSLRWVRHELDMLDTARMLSGFSPEDEQRYHELCRIERQLLGLVAA